MDKLMSLIKEAKSIANSIAPGVDLAKKAYGFTKKLDTPSNRKLFDESQRRMFPGRGGKSGFDALNLPRRKMVPSRISSNQKFRAASFKDQANGSGGGGVEILGWMPTAGFTAGTILFDVPINPSMLPSFAAKAQFFEQFQLVGLKVVYTPSCSTAIGGAIGVVFMPDVEDDVSSLSGQTLVQTLLQTKGAKVAQVFEPFELSPPHAGERGTLSPFWGKKFVTNSGFSGSYAPQLSNAGRMIIFGVNTMASSGSANGYFSVEYNVRFFGRTSKVSQTFGFGAKYTFSTGASASNPWGTTPLASTWNNVLVTLGSGNTFTLGGGSYVIASALTGTGLSGSALTTTGTLALGYAQTSATYCTNIAQVVSSGTQTITWSVSGTTVASGFLYICALPVSALTVVRPKLEVKSNELTTIAPICHQFDVKDSKESRDSSSDGPYPVISFSERDENWQGIDRRGYSSSSSSVTSSTAPVLLRR